MNLVPYPSGPISLEYRTMIRDLLRTAERLSARDARGRKIESEDCSNTLDERQGLLYTPDTLMKKGVPKMSNRFVAYYRVSTKKQGASGLGLEAQRADLVTFIERTGGEVAKEFTEVESGKNNDRPQLEAAIAFARRSKATLLVAKLDRLSRNLAFLASLMESGLDFIAVDNPHANRFTVHILAAVAEHERELISKRTKAALGAAKARGAKLGSARPGHWRGREAKRLQGALKGAKRAGEAHRVNADRAYADVLPIIQELHGEGKSLRAIAAELNAQGIPTRRCRTWGPAQVLNVLKREGGE